MSLYIVKLPVAGSVSLEVEADSQEEAIQEALEAFVIVDQIDDMQAYKSLDEHFVATDTHTPFTEVTVTKIEDRQKHIEDKLVEWHRRR